MGSFAITIAFWRWEIISYILSMSAFIVMVVVLAYAENKPEPRSPITLNAMVTIFSAVLRSALVLPVSEALSELKWIMVMSPQLLSEFEDLDLASRGPRGALRALFKWPLLQLRSLGSLIMVLSILIDPLSQNALQGYDCLTAVNTSATISTANNYTSSWLDQTQIAFGSNSRGLMQAAVYTGTMNPPSNATQALTFDCSTGNCRFERYSTLAICSSVQDISTSIKCEWNRTLPDCGPPETSEAYCSTPSCSLPSGLEVGPNPEDWKHPYFFRTGVLDAFTNQRTQWPILMLEILALNANLDCSQEQLNTNSCPSLPVAFRVELNPCVHTYNGVTITNSLLNEPLVSTALLPVVYKPNTLLFLNDAYYSLASDLFGTPNVDCSPSNEPHGLKTQSAKALQDGRHYALYDNNFPAAEGYDNRNDTSEIFWYDPRCTFAITPAGTPTLWDPVRTLFGSHNVSVSNAKGLATDQPNWRDEYGRYSYIGGDQWLLRLFAAGTANTTSVTKYMLALANSMTAALRRTGDKSNNVAASGTLCGTTSCVKVVWQWFVLDVLQLLLAVTFITVTIRRSNRITKAGPSKGGRGPWKSSVLPVLWSGLEEHVKAQHGTLDLIDEMEDASKVLEVMLIKTQHGQSIPLMNMHNASETPVVQINTATDPGPWVFARKRNRPVPKQHALRRLGAYLSDHLPI